MNNQRDEHHSTRRTTWHGGSEVGHHVFESLADVDILEFSNGDLWLSVVPYFKFNF